MVELAKETMHISVTDPVAASMNFLNEVAGRFPDAISLAAGRPYEDFYRTEDIARYLKVYTDHLAEQGRTPEQVRRALMQYGRTNGQIHDLIARLLATDEDIHVPAEAIAVTAGCQEAMVIVLRGLCAGPDDVLLAASPCYVGITGAARLLGIDVVPVPEGPDGLDPQAVAEVAAAVRAGGRTPRALYLVPDFSNPSGRCLDLPARQGLLDVATAEDLLILEDDPYGLFGLDDRPRPKLKSLDTAGRVIYLGSFAKSCFPGARVGFLVADQTVIDRTGRRTLLAEAVHHQEHADRQHLADLPGSGRRAAAGVRLQSADGQPRQDRLLPAEPQLPDARPGPRIPGTATRAGRHQVERAGRRLLRRRRHPGARRREAAGDLGRRVRRAVDPDELLLPRRRRQPRDQAVLQRPGARRDRRGRSAARRRHPRPRVTTATWQGRAWLALRHAACTRRRRGVARGCT